MHSVGAGAPQRVGADQADIILASLAHMAVRIISCSIAGMPFDPVLANVPRFHVLPTV